jgi:class 3 adenylate cyclase/tetratricopeptide (TPR) repeat protein
LLLLRARDRARSFGFYWSMMFSENRYPSRIKCGTGFFGIMLRATDQLSAVNDIAAWLESLGLSEYGPHFAQNHIDARALGHLSDQDLQELGVSSLGHRRKLLQAIADGGATPAPSEAAPSRPQGFVERRHLTLLFCDLVGSTALSARLDVEDLREIVNQYHGRCAQAIADFGGVVARHVGDGILAYFGYPQAHEDDAARAVRAGFALIDLVAKLGDGAGTSLRARVGIATGLVVAGDVVGAANTVVGETPNVAARIQAVAEPNAVVIDDDTRRLLGQLFHHRPLGSVPVEGLANPVPVWQVIEAGAVDNRFEALRAVTTPLVGRDEEIDVLLRRWRQAKAGNGCVVLISGEAGIGKSRIAQTLLDRVGAEPHVRLRHFCSQHHQDTALYPTIAHSNHAAGFRREDTSEQRLKKIRAMLAMAGNDSDAAIALFAALLSVPTGDRYPPPDPSAQKQKDRTIKALLAQVEGLARRLPVLMVVEDGQWGDPTSKELFDRLVERIPRLPVLAVVTARPEFAPPWVGKAHATLLCINRLPPERQTQMIGFVAGKALPAEIVDQIVDRADGVPLFVEELTKAMVESGVLADAGDRYTLAGPLPAFAVPTTLSASLLARLAPAREVAQIAAALGRQFSYELISAVADMPRADLDTALAQLVSSGLIFQRRAAPETEYSFKHALVQDAAYGTLLRRNRQHLHGRIAAVLEERFPDVIESQPALLARHCTEGGLAEKAAAYWLKAGQQAIASWAIAEAVTQLRKGLDLIPQVPDGAARQERELGLLMTIGHALMAARGYASPEAGEAFSRARRLSEQLSRPPQRARALGGQFAFRLVRAELEQAERHAGEMRDLGETYDNAKWRAAGAAASGCVCCYLGKFAESRAHYEQWVALWDPAYRAVGSTPEDYYVQGLSHLARTLLCLGHVDQALALRNQALAEARRLSPYTLVSAMCLAWYVDWAIGGAKSAAVILRSADEVLTLAQEQGFPLWLGVGNHMRGWCLGMLGQPEEGMPLLAKGVALRRANGAELLLPFTLATLAEIHLAAGQPDEALGQLDQAAAMLATTKERWAEADMHRLRGTVLQAANEAAAEASYRQALGVAREQNARFWELRAAVDLARLWHRQGKRSEARELLAPVYGWFTEGLDSPSLQDARAVLAELA